MPTESTFLLAGLFLLLAAAGWALGRFGDDEEKNLSVHTNTDYLKGLNFLLNEQTDQALEHFLKMVSVDDNTIETHFALGSLFRRRGEVNRAIRVHQNIIARPDLPIDQKDQALFSLAKDYLGAGLLDRAEKIFLRLSKGSRYQVQALESLCSIYEQEREWNKAIQSSKSLEVIGGNNLILQIAHYYCELAELALSKKDFTKALKYVQKAQAGYPQTMRGILTQASIAKDTNDNKKAINLFCNILEQQTHLIGEILPEIVSIYERENAISDLELMLKDLLDKNENMNALVAYSAIVNDIGQIQIIDQCVKDFMLNDSTLKEFVELQQISDNNFKTNSKSFVKVRRALSKLASTMPKYQCQECGFSSQSLLWQCPSCRNWETQRPASRIQFDAVLQYSITNQ
tara:strand:+ start:10038 stop:11240 length:1203 start_codon:yes stop_codon:yes gene_type:complete